MCGYGLCGGGEGEKLKEKSFKRERERNLPFCLVRRRREDWLADNSSGHIFSITNN